MATTTPMRKKAEKLEEVPFAPATHLNQLIGARIRQLREAKGRTQTEACQEALGNPEMQSWWSKWENGVNRPNVESLSKIADWGGVSLAAFGVEEEVGRPTEADLAEARELLRRALELVGGR